MIKIIKEADILKMMVKAGVVTLANANEQLRITYALEKGSESHERK